MSTGFRSCSHWDHTGGNAELKAAHPNMQVVGPADEKAKIPGIDVPVRGGDSVSMGSIRAHVLDVGGHTRGHIAYHLPAERIVFVGDALFALGCGRMFEGTPEQFWSSLKRLRDLPDETTVYWYVSLFAPNIS
jgi:hydroxyacylglutathione hydrolase